MRLSVFLAALILLCPPCFAQEIMVGSRKFIIPSPPKAELFHQITPEDGNVSSFVMFDGSHRKTLKAEVDFIEEINNGDSHDKRMELFKEFKQGSDEIYINHPTTNEYDSQIFENPFPAIFSRDVNRENSGTVSFHASLAFFVGNIVVNISLADYYITDYSGDKIHNSDYATTFLFDWCAEFFIANKQIKSSEQKDSFAPPSRETTPIENAASSDSVFGTLSYREDVREDEIKKTALQLLAKGVKASVTGIWNDRTITDKGEMKKMVAAWADGELPLLGFEPKNEREKAAYKKEIDSNLTILVNSIVSENIKSQSKRKTQKAMIGNETFLIPPPSDRRMIPTKPSSDEKICSFLTFGAEIILAELAPAIGYGENSSPEAFKKMAEQARIAYDDELSENPNIEFHFARTYDEPLPSVVTAFILKENDGTYSFVANQDFIVKDKILFMSLKRYNVDKSADGFPQNEAKYASNALAQWSTAIVSANADTGSRRREENIATGTGFFISPNGVVMTNYHVIEDAAEITVKNTFTGESSTAQVIRQDPTNDIAILKVKEENHPYLYFYTGSTPRKGEDIISLGYPLVNLQGQEQKATFGKINAQSGADGDIRFFQVDAPIQPGNSGGPLLNSHGEVIGINTQTANAAFMLVEKGILPQNINYAIKIDYAIPAARDALAEYDMKIPVGSGSTYSSVADVVAATEKAVALIIVK